MKDNEEMKKNLYFYYGAKGIADRKDAHKGYAFKTSMSLVENVISKKEERDLFSELETDGELAPTSASQEYTDRKGKRVNLSPFQTKLVTAFAQVVDTILEEGENKTYIKSLPVKMEERETGADGKKKRLPNSVRAVIDIPELTRLIYSSRDIGGKQTDKVKEEIKNLSEVSQVFKYRDERGGTLTIEAPLITLGKRVTYKTKSGVEKFNKIEVFFEDVFVYEINEKFSLSPITILQLWNETGVQTELFTMLLYLLIGVRGNHISHSEKAVKAKRKELQKEKRDAQEIERELAELKRSYLTYKESITSLLERIDSKRYYKGKYLRFDNLNKDLKQAKDALLKMGIISDFYESTGSSGDRVCNFVINENWLQDQANRIKNLLPPSEQGESETKDTGEA